MSRRDPVPVPVPRPSSPSSRLKTLTAEYRELKARLEQGGGPDKVRRQHDQGKLTARERIEALLDQGGAWFEIGLLVAFDQYDGQAPGAGVVTGLGRIAGRPVVVVANDATVKAGSWWPETIKKMLRAQEIAMRQRIPIVYLVDSAGVNLPYQGGVFPGQYGAARIFYYNSIMRHYLRVPQIAAVIGPPHELRRPSGARVRTRCGQAGRVPARPRARDDLRSRRHRRPRRCADRQLAWGHQGEKGRGGGRGERAEDRGDHLYRERRE